MRIKGTIPATGHDIANYMARYGITNYQIQTVMELDGELDFKRLKKAVKLSIISEPVLGCRFVEADPPYWKPFDPIDTDDFCFFEKTSDMEECIKSFLESPLKMDEDPMLKVKLIRSGERNVLCVKINHACADGAGAKDFLKLLSDMYTRISDDDKYMPELGKPRREDDNRLFKSLGIKFPELMPVITAKGLWPMWRLRWEKRSQKKVRFVVCRISGDIFNRMKSFSKAKNATINDLLLTALYRAMFKKTRPSYYLPMEIPVTVDLRRYLPMGKAEAIRNFSGGIYANLPRIPNENFEGTLARVSKFMQIAKGLYPGIENALAALWIKKIGFYRFRDHIKKSSMVMNKVGFYPSPVTNSSSPVLSNLGLIFPEPLKFGSITVTDAYMLPPAVNAPGILLLAATYNEILTLAIGYFEGTFRAKDIERILNLIEKELTEGCKNEDKAEF